MRELIERKRREVSVQITKLEMQVNRLQSKLTVYDELLAELGPEPMTVPSKWEIAPPAKDKRPYKPHTIRAKPVEEIIELALEAAGDQGITAKELADVASIPAGTISGRLSVMKSQGLVKHVSPKFFAVHSRREDNNTDQGVE